MRSASLRILMALLVGLWSPLCCCQAALLAGTMCAAGGPIDGAVATGQVQPGRTSCCSNEGCGQRVPEEDPRETQDPAPLGRTDPTTPPPVCPTCPACQGAAAGTGLLSGETKVESRDGSAAPARFDVVAAIADRAMEFALTTRRASGVRHRRCEKAHVRANRDAQRWHCALAL